MHDTCQWVLILHNGEVLLSLGILTPKSVNLTLLKDIRVLKSASKDSIKL